MEPDSRVCELCQTNILAKCFDIHKRACERKNQSSKKILNFLKEQKEDLIPCSQCGEMVSFSVYSVHIQECVGRQLTKCHQCKLLYPTFLIEEHLNYCDTFNQEKLERRSSLEAHPNNDYEEGSFLEEEDQQMEEMIKQLAANALNEDDPLTQREIDSISRTTTVQVQECSICYCSVETKTQILRLPCPHAFHLRCISAWLQKNPHCPMCRRFVLK